MTDVVIHRCTLRIVRRQGWSWGPGWRQLLDSATRALPALLARRLAGLWAGPASGEVVAPVRLTVPVRLADLLDVGYDTAGADDEAAPLNRVITERLQEALRDALPQPLAPSDAPAPAPAIEQAPAPPDDPAASGRDGSPLRL